MRRRTVLHAFGRLRGTDLHINRTSLRRKLQFQMQHSGQSACRNFLQEEDPCDSLKVVFRICLTEPEQLPFCEQVLHDWRLTCQKRLRWLYSCCHALRSGPFLRLKISKTPSQSVRAAAFAAKCGSRGAWLGRPFCLNEMLLAESAFW